jgi:hypothetical protein
MHNNTITPNSKKRGNAFEQEVTMLRAEVANKSELIKALASKVNLQELLKKIDLKKNQSF